MCSIVCNNENVSLIFVANENVIRLWNNFYVDLVEFEVLFRDVTVKIVDNAIFSIVDIHDKLVQDGHISGKDSMEEIVCGPVFFFIIGVLVFAVNDKAEVK